MNLGTEWNPVAVVFLHSVKLILQNTISDHVDPLTGSNQNIEWKPAASSFPSAQFNALPNEQIDDLAWKKCSLKNITVG